MDTNSLIERLAVVCRATTVEVAVPAALVREAAGALEVMRQREARASLRADSAERARREAFMQREAETAKLVIANLEHMTERAVLVARVAALEVAAREAMTNCEVCGGSGTIPDNEGLHEDESCYCCGPLHAALAQAQPQASASGLSEAEKTLVCSACGAKLTDDDSMGRWRFNGESWEHKCPGVHPQAGHFAAMQPGVPASAPETTVKLLERLWHADELSHATFAREMLRALAQAATRRRAEEWLAEMEDDDEAGDAPALVPDAAPPCAHCRHALHRAGQCGQYPDGHRCLCDVVMETPASAPEAACPQCGQVPSDQHGEYQCPACGLPTLHDAPEAAPVIDRETLADVQHEIWCHWMRYQFSVCTKDGAGGLRIPAASVSRWSRQMNTPYSSLTEKEKGSDREQADKVIAVLAGAGGREINDE